MVDLLELVCFSNDDRRIFYGNFQTTFGQVLVEYQVGWDGPKLL